MRDKILIGMLMSVILLSIVVPVLGVPAVSYTHLTLPTN